MGDPYFLECRQSIDLLGSTNGPAWVTVPDSWMIYANCRFNSLASGSPRIDIKIPLL
jgi:hypothetical protein